MLEFRFPEVHEQAHCSIEFQRTLRIPDDNNNYPLPPGLGRYPLRHLDDFAMRCPEAWRRRGGVFLPMHQGEAMWINFGSAYGAYPFAVKIATGKVCALTGDAWVNHLNQDPQDYIVLPEQPWLDGYCLGSAARQSLLRHHRQLRTVDGFDRRSAAHAPAYSEELHRSGIALVRLLRGRCRRRGWRGKVQEARKHRKSRRTQGKPGAGQRNHRHTPRHQAR